MAGQAIQFTDQVLTGDAALHHAAQALAGVLIDDRDDLDRSPIGGDVELEVHRPHPIRCISDDPRWRGRGTVAFTLSALRYPQPFLTPKTLDLLVIDDPPLAAGIMVGRPETAAGMLFGIGPQPLPQGGVRIGWRRRDRFVALGGAVLPGDAAGEPLADPQHALEVTNGCPPAFRA